MSDFEPEEQLDHYRRLRITELDNDIAEIDELLLLHVTHEPFSKDPMANRLLIRAANLAAYIKATKKHSSDISTLDA